MAPDSPQSSRQTKRVTILDVAAASGVPKSTVSRILDDSHPQPLGEKAEYVRRIAQELGYVRDASAASLRRGKTMTIGVIVPRLTDTVMALLYEQIAAACAKTNQFAFVATTQDKPDATRIAAESLIRRGVDGLILATARLDDDFPRELEQRNFPFALVLRTDGKSRASLGDDELGGYLATRHLLDFGHTHIGLIAGPTFASSSAGRVAGYKRALQEASIDLRTDLIVDSSFSIESGTEAAEQLLRTNNPPTAIFAVNDNTAIGALAAIRKMEMSVPEDISLVGYNDIPLVSQLPVPLTSIRVPFDQIASNALEVLRNRPANKTLVAKPTLIPRQSSRRI